MIDAPHDKSSRWSGIQQSGLSTFRQRQWITLKLDKVAVLSVHSSLPKLRRRIILLIRLIRGDSLWEGEPFILIVHAQCLTCSVSVQYE